MDHFQIKGKVIYQNLETGFWGILDEKKKKWRPVQMPEELQKDGLEVQVTAKKAREEISLFMWGQPIEIIDYS